MISQRRALQCAVLLACLVPLSAGGAGVILGPALLADTASPEAESHFRYLSGLLLGIGLAYVTAVPQIERHGTRFRLLGVLVFIGGLARLAWLLTSGHASSITLTALTMELAVTPALTLWQNRIAHL